MVTGRAQACGQSGLTCPSPQPRPQLSPYLLQTSQPRWLCFVRLDLCEPQADADHTAIDHLVHDQRNLAERQRVARPWQAPSMLHEMVGQRNALLRLCNRQPVDVGKLAERMLAGDEEIAEQQRVWPRRWRHVDKEAVERLRLLRRRQEIDIVTRAHRLGLGWAQDLLVA